ncbi:MAG: hypothetical protein WCC14_16625 [Acidobacteriaceae bacterium]
MRSRLTSVVALLLLATLAHAAKQVTIGQVEQMLSADRGLSDDVVPGQLAGLTLSERVSAERFAAWQALFPGTRSQHMLLILADESAFHPLPASELSPDPPPSLTAENKIFDAALEYANRTIHNLPNFLAVRQTLHFQTNQDSLDAVMGQARYEAGFAKQDAGSTYELVGLDLAPLAFTGQFSAPVTYRDGEELLNGRAAAPAMPGFTTSGEFGPILAIVLGDARQSSIVWGYWQRRGDTRLAVFRYRVPAAKSHYAVDVGILQSRPAYHGEIAVDPGSGSIFRISIVSDPAKLFEPASAIVIEYGPMILGSRAYIVPLHGVALGRIPVPPGVRAGSTTVVPVQNYLNDVTFTRYRLFRADARILSDEESRQLRDKTPAPAASAPQPQ